MNYVALDVGLVTIGEGLDTTTPAGRMAFGIFAAVAEFERERTRERILLALDRRRARGERLGRARKPLANPWLLASAATHQQVAEQLGVSVGTVRRRRNELKASSQLLIRREVTG